jgi:hypothetical protein
MKICFACQGKITVLFKLSMPSTRGDVKICGQAANLHANKIVPRFYETRLCRSKAKGNITHPFANDRVLRNFRHNALGLGQHTIAKNELNQPFEFIPRCREKPGSSTSRGEFKLKHRLKLAERR